MLGGKGYVFSEIHGKRHLKTGISNPADRGRSLRWQNVKNVQLFELTFENIRKHTATTHSTCS